MSLEWGNEDRDEPRLYDIPGHKTPLVSVTTVLRVYGDFLWANIVETRKHVEHLAMAHQQKKHVEHWMQDESGWQKSLVPAHVALLDAKSVSQAGLRMLKRSAEKGSLRHHMMEDWSDGVSIHEHEVREWALEKAQDHSYGVDVDEAVPSLVQLNRWLWRWKPKIVMSEARCYHYKLKYAGTFDAVVEIDHPLFKGGMIDLKPDRFERRYVAQLAAYSHATHLYTDDGKKMRMPAGLGAAVLMVGDERAGLRPIEPKMLAVYFEKMFRPALECWRAAKLELPAKGKEVWA
jgi:hypothetical protein